MKAEDALIHKNWPELQHYWEVVYGHAIPFKDCDRIKIRSDGNYIVVGWKTADGMVEVADLYYTGEGDWWEFCNDGGDPLTEEQWDKLYIPHDCDWFDIRGEKKKFNPGIA